MVAGPAKRIWWDNYQYTSTGHQEIHLHGEVGKNPPTPDLEELKDIVQEYKGEYKLKKFKRKSEE